LHELGGQSAAVDLVGRSGEENNSLITARDAGTEESFPACAAKST
jgi:hypothetical protein